MSCELVVLACIWHPAHRGFTSQSHWDSYSASFTVNVANAVAKRTFQSLRCINLCGGTACFGTVPHTNLSNVLCGKMMRLVSMRFNTMFETHHLEPRSNASDTGWYCEVVMSKSALCLRFNELADTVGGSTVSVGAPPSADSKLNRVQMVWELWRIRMLQVYQT